MKTDRLTGILNTPLFSLKDLIAAKSAWCRVIAESPLGDGAKSLIRDVVKRTRLWPGERHDVAEELVSHFIDGCESGKTETEMIQIFGNPSKAAGMIRRAKKKNRPMLWHLTVVLHNGFLSVIAVYSLMILMAVNKSPSPKIDYKALIDSQVPDIPLENTARETYLALIEKYDINAFKYSPPESPEWEETVRSFNSNYKETVPEIRIAASYDYSGLRGKYPNEVTIEERILLFNMTEEDFSKIFITNGLLKNHLDKKYTTSEILLPYTGLYRQFCRILVTNIILSGSANNWDTIPADIESIFHIANHSIEQPFYVNNLVAISCMTKAHDVTRRILINPDNLPEVRIIRQILNMYNQYHYICDFDNRLERYHFKDLIQHCYTDNGQGDGVVTKDGISITGIWWYDMQKQQDYYENQLNWTGLNGDYLAAVIHSDFKNLILPLLQTGSAGRKEIDEYLEQLWDLCEVSANLPLWKLHEYIVEWEKYGKIEYQGATIEAPSIDNLGHLFPVYEHIAPRNIAMRPVLNRANYDNTRLILALHGYYQETGHWPEVLSDLVPGWLDEVPPDASTGKPLIYRIEDGAPLIYGRGYDGVDNGGQFDVPEKPGFHWGQKPRDTGDWLIWPVPVIAGQDSTVD